MATPITAEVLLPPPIALPSPSQLNRHPTHSAASPPSALSLSLAATSISSPSMSVPIALPIPMPPSSPDPPTPPPAISPQQSVIRGRPRSTSISNGSPSPAPHAALPSLTGAMSLGSNGSSSARMGSGSNSSGEWTMGHRGSLSVPGLATPTPVTPGSFGSAGFGGGLGAVAGLGGSGRARVDRHRRTHSVSPPGFPSISELTTSGFHEPPTTAAVSIPGVPPRHSPRAHTAPNSSSSHHHTHFPHLPIHHHSLSANSSPFASPSTSPSSPVPHFTSSHAALLYGVRSHALPHSPTLDPSDAQLPPYHASSLFSHSSPSLSGHASAAQSPPFGPTPVLSHVPSPLALLGEGESPFGSPDDDTNADLEIDLEDRVSPSSGSAGPGDLSGLSLFAEDGRLPGAFDTHAVMSTSPGRSGVALPRAYSPPLLPLPPLLIDSNSPSSSECTASAPNGGRGRSRSASIGSAEATSPAALFLTHQSSSPQVQCDQRMSPQETHTTSPPPSPPLRPASPPLLSTSPRSPPPAAIGDSFAASFSPPPSASAVLSTSPTTPSPLLSPAAISAAQSSTILPPPSPHRSTISLPPPIVAPTPLPSHLGGPVLQNHQVLPPKPSSGGGRKAAAKRHSEALKEKLAGHIAVGSEFVPKRHSPLASPALSGSEESSGSESEEEDEVEEGEIRPVGEMDLGIPESETTLEGERADRPLDAGKDIPPHLAHDGQDAEAVARALDEAGTTDMDLNLSSSALRFHRTDREGTASPLSPPSDDSPSTLPVSAGEMTLEMAGIELGTHGERRNAFGALGFMDVDEGSGRFGDKTGAGGAIGDLSGEGEEQGGDGEEVIAIDEESLSALEKIFVCAKSENPSERARVAHNLADWLRMVDIEEAVEYVLPLLAGLATDTEELVKEGFAPQLDTIMWHFFSQCPLLEVDPTGHEAGTTSEPGSPVGSPVPSRYTAFSHDANPSPTSTTFVSSSEDSSHSLPTTSETSPSNTEVSEAPRISVTTFTSLLGALLTDQSAQVANSTQATLVRFLCRLKGKDMPIYSPMTKDDVPAPSEAGDAIEDEEGETTPQPGVYHLTEAARRILEDEFINGIVLGLARLDDDLEGDRSMEGVEESGSTKSETPSRQASSTMAAPVDDGTHSMSSSLVLSPEEELIEDGWMTSAPGEVGTAPASALEGWGEPLVSYFNDSNDRPRDEYTRLLPDSSPMDQPFSSFSPDGHADEESAIGKLVSMSLITAIAATDCFGPEVLAEQLLPEVERMKCETTFYVRKEAVQALGSLARSLPAEVFESTVLPLHAAFAQDTLWHVRRAACLALPTICKRLTPATLRSEAIRNIKLFTNDTSRNVRSGALEVCGELIYLFHGDPLGVPDELLAFFLAQPSPNVDALDESPFAPLSTALDSPPQPFFDSSPWSVPPNQLFAQKDPDRPVMCAFNLPAVALTLGRAKWPLLRGYYLTLCDEKVDKVRQSLASSMHEVAKIIGPVQADADLLEPFSRFVRDYDFIQGALLENITSLLSSFSIHAARKAILLLGEAWGVIRAWRRREGLSKDLAGLVTHFVHGDAAEEVLLLLSKAFKDPVAAVREQAVASLPTALASVKPDTPGRSKLSAFLAVFCEDSSFRNRVTYTSCALAAVRSGLDRSTFEAYFLDSLARLARDKVINVRISVARVVAEACRSPELYADPEKRSPILDTLQHLSALADRDVIAAISPLCAPSQTSASLCVQISTERSGARSRMDMYEEDDVGKDNNADALPVARRSHPNLHGIDDDNDMDDVPLSDRATSPSSPPSTWPAQDVDESKREADGSDGDVEMFDEGVFLEAPGDLETPSPGASPQVEGSQSPLLVVTRELEGEDEFLEVSRR